eukprot:GHVQ01012207.1.p2 GENE.GHVQ01012207.1~~GHVQ01012207.1.p2  ORF type:complete len:170 (-),score=6.77 GHVQ01012207.1:1946-2455(-)
MHLRVCFEPQVDTGYESQTPAGARPSDRVDLAQLSQATGGRRGQSGPRIFSRKDMIGRAQEPTRSPRLQVHGPSTSSLPRIAPKPSSQASVSTMKGLQRTSAARLPTRRSHRLLAWYRKFFNSCDLLWICPDSSAISDVSKEADFRAADGTFFRRDDQAALAKSLPNAS